MGIPVVISAAGKGTRMQALTQAKPKHLIEVGGKPFLSYLLDNLRAAGYRELYLVVGYLASAAYAFAESYQAVAPLKVVNQFERWGEEHYGTLVPLQAVAPELTGRAVLAVNGDNLYSVRDLAALARRQGSVVAGCEHEHPERYGVLVPRAGARAVLERIVEKPAQPPSALVNTGLYRFSEKIWGLLPRVSVSARGEYELTEAVNALAQREPVSIYALQDPWLDLGRPEDIPLVEASLAQHS